MSKGHIKIRVHCFVVASRHLALGTVMYIIMYSMFDPVGYQYTNCCGMPPRDFRLLMWRAEVLCSPPNAIQISLPRGMAKCSSNCRGYNKKLLHTSAETMGTLLA